MDDIFDEIMEEAHSNRLVQCKRIRCLFNMKMYVPQTDTLQYCCGRASKIIRLNENGECIYHPDKKKKGD